MNKRILWTAAIIYLLSQIFFLINIQFPRGHNFDEFHYVPSAKQFLALKENQNWEHPPLGKLLMAVGIAVWGDRPMGWRFMSTVFGALTLVGMYFLGLVLFENEVLALWIVGLTVANHLLYVQARIGMLDTFMFGFLIWGVVAFCATWNPKNSVQLNKRLFAATGLLFGLSTACKWFTIVPWLGCLGLIFFIRMLQSWQTTFAQSKEQDWYRPDLWKGIERKDWVIALGIIPVVAYFFTFIPFLFIPGHSVLDFIPMQIRMWQGQLRVVSSHPYMSQWTDWPLLSRPIWYAFDREEGGAWVRGVLLLGNPLIMWGGLLAMLACGLDWITRRRKDAFLIFFFYAVFYGCWIVIPRKILFYYYYYPAGMMLSFALAYLFHYGETGKLFKFPWARWVFLGAALGIFIYFFPILAALKIPSDAFRKWMWFSSWI